MHPLTLRECIESISKSRHYADWMNIWAKAVRSYILWGQMARAARGDLLLWA